MASKHKISALTWAAVIGLCFFCSLVAQEVNATKTWTSVDGKAIEADFVRLTDDGVVLRLKANGREAEVALSKLSIDSHLQAIKLGNPEAFSKPLPKAKVEVEPLEPSNVVDADASLESPFTGDESIDQFLDTLKQEYTGGNYFVLWHCIPLPLQADIEDLAVKAMAKVGTAPIAQIRTLMKDAKTVVWEKEKFVFGNPLVAGNPQVANALKEQWPLIREYVASLANDELWQRENFEKGKIVPWAAKLMAAFGQHHDSLDKATGGKQNAALDAMFKVTKQTATSAELEFNAEGQPPQKLKAEKLPKVWIVTTWMAELRKAVDQGLAQIDAAPDVSGPIQGALAFTVAPALTALKNAQSQEEFDLAISNIQAILSSFTPPGAGGSAGGGPTLSGGL